MFRSLQRFINIVISVNWRKLVAIHFLSLSLSLLLFLTNVYLARLLKSCELRTDHL